MLELPYSKITGEEITESIICFLQDKFAELPEIRNFMWQKITNKRFIMGRIRIEMDEDSLFVVSDTDEEVLQALVDILSRMKNPIVQLSPKVNSKPFLRKFPNTRWQLETLPTTTQKKKSFWSQLFRG